MRKRLVTILIAGTIAASGFGIAAAPSAQAVCGGGAPGEPCYCPPGIGVPGKKAIVPIYC